MHLKHFSHQHPLVFTDEDEGAHCAGCKEAVIGPAYCCTVCRFHLDKRCAELPLTILHPLHPQHTLTLLEKSPHPKGKYMCDRCKRIRKGFVYHCSTCKFDLDSNCAFDHWRIITEFDISGDVKIVTAKASEERYPISTEERRNLKKAVKLDTFLPNDNYMSQAKAFDAKDSEEKKYQRIETSKLDTLGGNPWPSVDLSYPSLSPEKYLISEQEKRYQGETGNLDAFRGKKSNVETYEVRDIVKKEKKQQGEIGTSSDNILSPCIFKTPFPKLEFQKPELISIGPYHRDEEHQLDKYKHSFLEKLLHRTSNNPERDLCFYVEEFIALEKRARACYCEDSVMSSRDFVKMMLLDGCFIIELLRHFGGAEVDLCPKDPINIIMPWQIPVLVQDLLLLENQMPFFVLEMLFELSKNHEGKPEVSLITVALKFFDLAFPRSSDFISEFSHLKPNHLLDLFVKTIPSSNSWSISNLLRPTNRGKWNISHSFFENIVLLIQMRISDLQDLIVEAINLETATTNRKVTENHPSAPLKRSASSSRRKRLEFKSKGDKHEQENQSPIQLDKTVPELLQAGIAFMASRSNSFLNFNFKDGILEIPLVTINNLFSTILVNSVALENCSPYYSRPKPVTNYIYFMSCLIKEANDVQFLCSKGIISRLSNNDKKVADLFNLLRAYAFNDVSDSHFWKTIRAIQCYNGRSRKPMRQFLMETLVVLIMFYACTLLIFFLFYLRYIPRKWAQFLAVYESTSLICVLSLQRSWRHVLRNPVQLMVIISTFICTFVLLMSSYLG